MLIKDLEPDAVYDDHPMNRKYLKWYDEVQPQEGDYIKIETTTERSWQNAMEVTKADPDELTFESVRGRKYMIVTYASPNSMVAGQPTIRAEENFESVGLLDRIEVYKG